MQVLQVSTQCAAHLACQAALQAADDLHLLGVFSYASLAVAWNRACRLRRGDFPVNHNAFIEPGSPSRKRLHSIVPRQAGSGADCASFARRPARPRRPS